MRARPYTVPRRDRPLEIISVESNPDRADDHAQIVRMSGQRATVVKRIVSALGCSVICYVVVAEKKL